MSVQAELQFESIPQISFAVDGDIIHLEQDVGCGEVDRVDLHRLHLAHLCKEAGIVAVVDQEWTRERILRLAQDTRYVADGLWLDEICERLSDGLAYRIAMTTLLRDVEDLAKMAAIEHGDSSHCGEAPGEPDGTK